VPSSIFPSAAVAKLRLEHAKSKDEHSVYTSWALTNPTGAQKEVTFRVTDFFDSTGDVDFPIQQYQYSLNQTFFDPGPDLGTAAISRVKSFHLYALPQFELTTDTSSVLATYALPVNTDGINGTACQQATLLTPTSVSDWVPIGSWYANKVFGNSNITMAVNASGSQVLGAIAFANPDDGLPFTGKIQMMARFEVAQTLPPLTLVQGSVPSSNAILSWSSPTNSPAGPLPAVVTPLGISQYT
jgi:hypothetical protein